MVSTKRLRRDAVRPGQIDTDVPRIVRRFRAAEAAHELAGYDLIRTVAHSHEA